MEGMHYRLILSPFSNLNSYEENSFELTHTSPELIRSYLNLGFYLKENDKIGVWKLYGPPKGLLGLILRNNFLIHLEKVESEEKLKYYDKILTSPGVLVEGYNKIYKDRNLCLWTK